MPSTQILDSLFREHGRMVRNLLLRLVGPCAELDDLVQTTFLEALRSLPRFRGDSKPSTWICGIAVHVAQHQLRSRRVWRYVDLEGMHGRDLVEEDRERSLDAERVAERLADLLACLRPEKREALLLHVLDEKPVREIARTMSTSQTATRSRMFFARRELRALIARDPALREHAEGMLRRARADHPKEPHAPSLRRHRVPRPRPDRVRPQLAVVV